VARIENTEFKDGAVVFERNTKCDRLVIVLEGSLHQVESGVEGLNL
jgi:hypothetical protein